MDIQTKTLSAEEFWHLYAGQRYELVRGVPVAMMTTSEQHGEVANLAAFYVTGYVIEHKLGRVYAAETGFQLARDPDIVRGPDVAFIAASRLPQIEDRTRTISIPPDLVIEVVSPNDRAAEINEKIQEYLSTGVRLIWVIYPEQQTAMIYHADGRVEKLDSDGALMGGEVLPGFSLPTASLFPTPA